MKKIEDGAAIFFAVAIAILSGISILGIWDFFERDVVWKSFQTLGLLAIVAIIILIAGKFIEKKSENDLVVFVPNPLFKTIRHITLTILITSISLLAILGVLAIWEVIEDKDVLYKSLASVGILVFSSFILVMTCLDREDSPILRRQGRSANVGGIIFILFVGYLLLMMLGRFY